MARVRLVINCSPFSKMSVTEHPERGMRYSIIMSAVPVVVD